MNGEKHTCHPHPGLGTALIAFVWATAAAVVGVCVVALPVDVAADNLPIILVFPLVAAVTGTRCITRALL
ncbi:hypothetical protein ACTOB_003708 [Actinoplanes oblitus]|uniref:Uncharacterized protein n=1 Tax=Actinoplanes oblitus TaxID=3040509 RepID=A0ABY8WTA5_9ACTN|nr:hypothetical protein [Actinoplanes oblitus]WIN00033.1 hypothetical protein ACTOB_003708 [Actinoplanes oblitus]